MLGANRTFLLFVIFLGRGLDTDCIGREGCALWRCEVCKGGKIPAMFVVFFFFCLDLVFVMYKVCFSGWLVAKGRVFPKKSGEADKKKVEKCTHSAEKASYGVLE